MESFLRKECDLDFFHENGFIRKKCKQCGSYFWTLDKDATLCGDQPCVEFGFIDNHLGKKSLSLSDVRESFISFFENKNHSRIRYPNTGERCPVVARWRSDIYLTIASIADFQPHVTSGEIPPPANPLVISQPCIRLNDLEEVGKSGRHLTTFEMMGHHAFNKEKKDEIYFKEKTVEYCDEYFVKKIGIPRNKITYKEQLWSGGGNAGPCLEVLAGGLEIATLVFMNMQEDKDGEFTINGKKYSKNPLRIVDTGYGLERIAWCTQGTKTVYETVFPEIVDWIKKAVEDEKYDRQSLYSLADHTKCLAFMLGDGIVPSNVKAGYLARLIIRRALRFLEKLDLKFSLAEIVNKQLDVLEEDFPSLTENKDQIYETLDLETEKYRETIEKGTGLVKKILKEKEDIDTDELIKLYDTHGMPPEIVKKIADKRNVNIEIPENFDSMIAELHSHEEKEEMTEKRERDLPESLPLYYKDHYGKEFNAEVIWKNNVGDKTEVILDKTCFYPEGGGQPGDTGFLTVDGKRVDVENTVKEDGSIIHYINGDIEVGDRVHGKIDWERRYNIMKHHTGTHVVNGALRKILGEQVWQAGSQLRVEEARFDFSHYKPLSEKEKKKIERYANDLIKQGREVNKKVMDRNTAEQIYGFRLYQGGVPPGNSIRVLDIPGVDVEACGGTHLDNINEIGKIRILKHERIQDGVNRVVFAAGEMADFYKEKEKRLYDSIVETLSSVYEIKRGGEISEELNKSAEIFSVPLDQLHRTVKRFLEETKEKRIGEKVFDTLSKCCSALFEQWKETQKEKKQVASDEIKVLKDKAEEIDGTDIMVIVGKSSSEGTAVAGELTKEENYVVHIFDGDKIVSSASKNVDIDLRDIAKELGKILGGGGGGKPKMVQCGGPKIENLDEALEKAKLMTEEKIE